MITLLTDRGIRAVDARVDGERLWVDGAALEAATGWTVKPQGLCRDEACIPLPPGRQGEFVQGGRVDAASVWRHLDQPIVRDDAREIWVLGEGADERAAALASLVAPDFTLPDVSGRPHSLSDYRGKKVFLVSWASW
jgi:AhpC/TSA family protein